MAHCEETTWTIMDYKESVNSYLCYLQPFESESLVVRRVEKSSNLSYFQKNLEQDTQIRSMHFLNPRHSVLTI